MKKLFGEGKGIEGLRGSPYIGVRAPLSRPYPPTRTNSAVNVSSLPSSRGVCGCESMTLIVDHQVTQSGAGCCAAVQLLPHLPRHLAALTSAHPPTCSHTQLSL